MPKLTRQYPNTKGGITVTNEYQEELAAIKDEIATISRVSHEYETYLKTKAIRIRNIIIGILLFFLVTSNVIWIVYESQFETVTETTETIIEGIEQTADNNGNNNVIGGDYYGGKAKD